MKNTLAKCNEDAYLPSLHLSTVELRCKLQEIKITPCDMALKQKKKLAKKFLGRRENILCACIG